MPSYPCPKGHPSTEEDFCSECGVKINGANSSPSPAAACHCPDCGSPCPADGTVFCEVCGYNYQTGGHGEIPRAAPVPVPVPVPEPEPAVVPSPASWVLVACPEASLKEQGSPDPPPGLGPFSFTIDKDSLLIGRRNEARGIFPEIPLNFDSAVSHRHALLTKKTDATLLLRDIGSSNGTRVNGSDIPPMTDVPLREGDRITLGHWTCLTVEKEK